MTPLVLHPEVAATGTPSCCMLRILNVHWFLLVGVIAGWLAGVLVKGGGFGLLGDLVVGILGSILVATMGAVLLLVLIRVIKRA